MSLDFVAGWAGGVAGIFVGHPLDTVKVNLQTQSGRNPKYRGTWHCIRSLLVKDGIRGIYRGVSSPMMGVAAINGIVFAVYASVQKNMSHPDSLMSHTVAGMAAGLLTSFISSPMELVKSRIQVAGDQAGKNPFDCLIKMYKQHKLRGVFKGINITLAREVPAYTSYFVTYEQLAKTKDDRIASAAQVLFAGGVAGMVSWAIIYPIDVIKSKFQVDGIISQQYSSYYDCFKKTVSSQGYGSLFRGLSPTLLRAFPVNAVTFFVVTWILRLGDMEFNVPDNIIQMSHLKEYLGAITEESFLALI